MRDFWRGEPAALPEFASRLTGSADLYESSGRRPFASINFVTAHDGFTMRDLVSYNEKHNEANGENNADGESNNRSWNCGEEGPTDNPDILDLRERQIRNFISTLLLSQGVPMISHGDEIGRTQGGNNNTYCQDNEIAWMDWDLDERQMDILQFTRAAIAFRKNHPVFRRRRFVSGFDPVCEGCLPEIEWFRPDSSQMEDSDWDSGFARALMVFLNGAGIREPDERGNPIIDDDVLLMFNAGDDEVEFAIPGGDYAREWTEVVNTAAEVNPQLVFASGDTTSLIGRSMRVFVHEPSEEDIDDALAGAQKTTPTVR